MYDYKDIRNFYFENEIGKRIDCQNVTGGLFLYNVTGLGYEENIEYEQIGNSFVPNSKKPVQNVISGDLEFYDMTYNEYCNFVDFILTSNEIKLIYVPKTSTRDEYYRDIDFCKIDKMEEDDYNVLNCPITINCKSLWYKKSTAIFDMKSTSNEIRWDFKWDSKFSNYDTRKLTFVNKGHTDAPIEVMIDGHIQNPKIEVYVEGDLLQEVPFNVEIFEYEKFLYGTKENKFYVKRQKTDGTMETLFKDGVIDIANDNVVRLPKNKSCEIRLTSDNGIQNAKVEIFTFYKAV